MASINQLVKYRVKAETSVENSVELYCLAEIHNNGVQLKFMKKL